tara:strand:- start:144 stop:359 length:216 start_codon:yes stop_codon:yes gene_type:complete
MPISAPAVTRLHKASGHFWREITRPESLIMTAHAVNMKDGFCDIDSNSDNDHLGFSSSSRWWFDSLIIMVR